MPISGQVPNHLVVNARTGFLTSMMELEMPYKRFTKIHPMDAKTNPLVDLGAAPMPKNSSSGMTIQDFIEKSLTLTVEEWDITVYVEYNAVQDDQTGSLRTQVEQAGLNFEKHKNKLAMQLLNGGDAGTFGLGYDGQFYFDSDHVDVGGHYQTSQDNVSAINLSLNNFNTVWADSQLFRDDQGEFISANYDLLITHPSNRKMANNITSNPEAEGTGNRDANPFVGEFDAITTPEFDTNAWVILATGEAHKPLILADRESPNLQHAWFDPAQPGGGWFLFKFYSRYDLFYGDWRLGHMGQT